MDSNSNNEVYNNNSNNWNNIVKNSNSIDREKLEYEC